MDTSIKVNNQIYIIASFTLPMKYALFLSLMIIIFIPLASAISTDMKSIYQPGETMIIEIQGNILESIDKSQVELKRLNVQVPWEYDVKRLNNKYFLYGSVPKNENNYTLYIKDISTTENGIVKSTDFNQTFEVSGQVIEYSINPGFAILTDKSTFIITSNSDSEQTITISLLEEKEFILQPGQNTLEIKSSELNNGLNYVQIGIYNVPILVNKGAANLPSLRFFPKTIESILLKGETKSYPFSIINQGNEKINFILEYNTKLFAISPSTRTIEPKETLNFFLTPLTKDSPIEETIVLMAGNFKTDLRVMIDYTLISSQAETPYLDTDYSETQGYYCQELGGSVCGAAQECSGQIVSSLDRANCCVGSCTSLEGKSYAWIGYLLGAVVIIALAYIGFRYYKTKTLFKPKLKTLKPQ
mgnify:CR=1 FL=1